MESNPVGEEAAMEQVVGGTADGDAARVDSTTGDTPDREMKGVNRTREDEVNAVLEILLADHPEAVFYAIDANGDIVPMPDSVDLTGHELIEGQRTASDMVVPG